MVQPVGEHLSRAADQGTDLPSGPVTGNPRRSETFPQLESDGKDCHRQTDSDRTPKKWPIHLRLLAIVARLPIEEELGSR